MALRFRRNRRDRSRLGPRPPKETTHVLEYVPAWLLEPDPTGGQGYWLIQTLANWEAGTFEGDVPEFDGPADASEPLLAEFASRELGVGFIPRPVRLTRFEVEVSPADGEPGPECQPVPAYYVTPR